MRGRNEARDYEVLWLIDAYLVMNRCAISISELCEATGRSSKSTMQHRLARMRLDGLVDFADREPRTLSTTVEGRTWADDYSDVERYGVLPILL